MKVLKLVFLLSVIYLSSQKPKLIMPNPNADKPRIEGMPNPNAGKPRIEGMPNPNAAPEKPKHMGFKPMGPEPPKPKGPEKKHMGFKPMGPEPPKPKGPEKKHMGFKPMGPKPPKHMGPKHHHMGPKPPKHMGPKPPKHHHMGPKHHHMGPKPPKHMKLPFAPWMKLPKRAHFPKVPFTLPKHFDMKDFKKNLNEFLEKKYDFLVEMRKKMDNEGLTEGELRKVLRAVPELNRLQKDVKDLMRDKDENGRIKFN